MFLLICSRWKIAVNLTLVVFFACIGVLYDSIAQGMVCCFIQFTNKTIMQAAKIRDKYKQILEEPEEDSEDEWPTAYSQIPQQRKKKVLTENSLNFTHQENLDNPNSTLALKQKIAQCLSNCKQHCKEIEKLKKEQLLFADQKAEWRNEEAQYARLIEEERNQVKLHLERIKQLQLENQELDMRCQELAMERELQQKQAEFYKAELSQLQVQLERKQKEFKHCEKDYKSYEKIKKENQHLKADVERLSQIIEDSMRFGRVSGELLKKHFLGKPHRELEFWYPQQLVGEVEHFLKKNQFTSNLVKFIQRIQQKTRQQGSNKLNGRHASSSKPKEKDCLSLKKTNKINLLDFSNKKHSYNLSSMRDEHLLRSNTNSFWKSNESRVMSSPGLNLAAIKTQCWDIVNEFRSVVFQLLLEKEIKKKKIKKLIDSMCGSLMELFEANQCFRELTFSQQKKDDFCKLRLATEEISATLK